jgi:hypothetical protein
VSPFKNAIEEISTFCYQIVCYISKGTVFCNHIQKDKFSSIYNYLDYTFTNKLNYSDLCLIIGYSFRDEDITTKLIESMKLNKRLWIVLICPNSSDLIRNLQKGLEEEQIIRIIHYYLKYILF